MPALTFPAANLGSLPRIFNVATFFCFGEIMPERRQELREQLGRFFSDQPQNDHQHQQNPDGNAAIKNARLFGYRPDAFK